MKKRKKFTNRWRKFLVIGLVVLIAGSSSLQGAVALEKDFNDKDKKVKNEKQENIQKYIPGQVIIKLKDGATPDYEFLRGHRLKSAKKVLKENKAGKNVKAEQAFKKHGLDRIYLAEFSSKEDLIEVIERLNEDSRIEYAEPNYEVKADIIPNDLDFEELWGLENWGQTGGTTDADIDASDAWDYQTGRSSVVIAVIDTGVDYNHEDLVSNIWTNSGEIPGNGTDDDGNGHVDDVHGYDFANYDGDPMDDHGHGTHCAGTIGAEGDNIIGVVGVNWDVSIMPVKFLSASGSGSTDGAIASVNYATLMGVDIMSNSWGGGGFSQSLEDAISAANDAGILFVAAAGNNGSNNDIYPHYPSSYDVPNVIAVASTDYRDNKAGSSCYGVTSVDLGAPGVNIYSTVPTGLCSLCDPSGYKYLSGTSMATPHVAGAAGLLKAQYPELSSEGLKTRLLGGVDLISSMDGITVTGGRLNVLNSLEEDSSPPATVSTLATTGATHNSVSLSWTAVGDDGHTGTASSYDVRYATFPIISETDWNSATQAQGEPSPQASESKENFTVENLGFDTEYHFALKVADNVGNQSGLSNYVSEHTVPDNEPPSAVMDLNFLEATYSSITLKWTATGDDIDTGTASEYDIRYSTSSILTPEDWDDAIQIQNEPAPQVSGSTENFTVGNLEPDTTYHFALKAIDKVGNCSVISNVVSGTTETITIVFSDDMESVASGWTHGGVNDKWELGSPTSGPGFSSSGSNAWATNLDGNYGSDYLDIWLASPSINLNGISSAKLAFQHYYKTESYYDGGIVEISTDGGVFWTQITPEDGYPEDRLSSGNPLGSMPAYSGYSGAGWHPAVFDISRYDGYSNINIRFRFGTDYSIHDYPGWYIDDVVIFGQDNGGNIPPVADAGEDQIGNVQEIILFDGSASYDVDGLIVLYSWDFGDDTIGTGVTVDHIYQDGGNYNVTLVVLDEDGSVAYDVAMVTIHDPIPPAAIDDLNEIEFETTHNSIMLDWTAVGDDGLIGQAQTYDIRYSMNPIDESNFFDANEFLEKPSPQPSGSVEAVNIYPLDSDTTYYFAIKVIDDVDNISLISNVVQATTSVFVNTPPTAYLEVPGSGFVGESIQIYGGGSDPDGDPLTYKWDFGDGDTMTDSMSFVEHIYTNDETYTITLVVNDGLDDSLPVTADIVIKQLNQPPVADAGEDQVVNDMDGDGVEIVTLNGSGSSDPDGTVLSYAWFEDLGSGVSPSPICTGVSPECSFSVGTHAVILIVTDSDLATASDEVIITVNQPPVADAGPDQTINNASGTGWETVAFDGTGSDDPDGDRAALFYEWKEGDTGLSIASSFSRNFTVGVHTITLTVTDTNGATNANEIVIEIVANKLPEANIAGEDRTSFVGEAIDFSGSGSDEDGNITSYVWDFGDGSTMTGDSAAHIYNSVGIYTVELTVADNGGATATDTIAVTVIANQLPVANAGEDHVIEDIDGDGLETILFDSTGSSDPEGGALTYEWKEGDVYLSNASSFYRSYPVGTYTIITLTVTDNLGATASDEVLVQIKDRIIVKKALYDSKKHTLTVEVTSTSNGAAILTVEDSWVMDYNVDRNLYSLTITDYFGNLTDVTVSSSFYGEATADITNKFKK